MANVVMTGGGLCGLLTAMLLANDGHDVTVLERDAMEPPDDPDEAWTGWERRGVNQFRLGHFLLPRFREVADAELPDVVTALDAAGALRYNFIDALPAFVTGGHRDGDERFEAVTARRPVVEAAVAAVARATPRLTVRRGVGVEALLTGPGRLPGIPHVTGVRTAAGEDILADLVVDATGRRSPLPRWLTDAGARPAHEELDDCGFVYYGRHFRSPDGSLPPPFGPPLNPFGSISALTLPCDQGTWTVVLVASASDPAMRRLKDEQTWISVVRELPTVAHWLEGEPLDDIAVMAKIEDRYRRYVVDGSPVATGVVPVADSWACTNPSVGRGISMGLMHGVLLRDTLVKEGLDDPAGFALAYDAATVERLEPLYRDTLAGDRQRLGEMAAAIEGRPPPAVGDDERTKRILTIAAAAATDPDLLRATASIGTLITTPEEVFADSGLMERAMAAEVQAPVPGPSRERLLELVS